MFKKWIINEILCIFKTVDKSNNDPIKHFTVEVKDLVTTEEIMMLGELSMDD
nr:2244_t:CDS:2 [Entrophospora candida]